MAEKVLEIGNPRLDILKINLGKSVQNQTIGVLTRFNSINQFDGRPAAYTLTNQKNERTLGNVLDQVTAFFHFYKGILALLEYTDHHINIRSYPLENPRFYETIFKQQIADGRVDVDDQLDYGSWLKGQSLILTLSSTAFLEAYLTKTPIILLDRFCGVEERNRRLDKVTGLAFSVASIPATVAELVEMVMSPKRIRRHADIDKYLRDFHNWDKEVSVIANARDSILEKFSEKSERSIRLRVPEYLLSILEYGKFFQERRRGRLNPLNYTRFKHGSAYDVPKLVNQLEALQTNGQ